MHVVHACVLQSDTEVCSDHFACDGVQRGVEVKELLQAGGATDGAEVQGLVERPHELHAAAFARKRERVLQHRRILCCNA